MTLNEKQQRFAVAVARLILKADEMGYAVTFGEAYRTPEQAKLNAQKGSGIANSLHTQRLAVDLQLFKDGVYLTESAGYKPLGEWWELYGDECCWGGRFTRADGNHFSWTHNGVK